MMNDDIQLTTKLLNRGGGGVRSTTSTSTTVVVMEGFAAAAAPPKAVDNVVVDTDLQQRTSLATTSNTKKAPSRSNGSGHLFLGCLWCDMRQAVIWVNVISIIFGCLQFGIGCLAFWNSSSVGLRVQQQDANGGDDDDDVVSSSSDNLAILRAPFGKLLIGLGIGAALFGFCGIDGASKGRLWLVCAAMLYHCNGMMMNLYMQNLIGAFFRGLFAFPHIVLCMELLLSNNNNNGGGGEDIMMSMSFFDNKDGKEESCVCCGV